MSMDELKSAEPDRKEYKRLWRLKNINRIKKVSKKYKESHPLIGRLCSIADRCRNKNTNYFKRGIKCYLTYQDLVFLWDRDKAWLLKHPSVDRIDNDGHYTRDNCRFIEFVENARLGGLVGVLKKQKLHQAQLEKGSK